MLAEIKHRINILRKSEARVADYILNHPNESIFYSIKQLAEQADVSEPTVIRFCKAMGLDGFTDFKVRLARSLGPNPITHVTKAINPKDSLEKITQKLFSNTISDLEFLEHSIDIQIIKKAIDLLHKAKRIEIYGQGASGIVAQDAQQKLFRIGIPVIAYQDSHIHCMSATTLSKNDVVVAISHTGRSEAIINSAKLAKAADAKVISITAAVSPLSEIADLTIFTYSKEDTYTYIPMTSRINDLQVIDLLATGLSVKKGERLKKNLIESKKALFNKYLTD